MALFLVEVELPAPDRSAAERVIATIADTYAATGGSLVEAQVTGGHERVFAILEGDECAGVTLDAANLPEGATASAPVPVRIVGASVDDVRAAGGSAGYLVEWDIPAEITMDQYLARKREKSPLYDTLDDVAFLRTYVREDTQKCLCFYNADDESAVRNAREVVSTPISRLHALDTGAVRV